MAPVSAGLEYRLYHTQHRECSCGAKDCQGECKAKGEASPVANPPQTLPSNGNGALMSHGNGPHGSNAGHGAGRKRKLCEMAGNKMSESQSLMVDAMVDAALTGLVDISARGQFSSHGHSQGPSQATLL